MKKTATLLLLLALLRAVPSRGQMQAAAIVPDSVARPVQPLTLFGFADAYYGFDFTGSSQERPFFLYSHNRANEFALNNAIVGMRYTNAQVRGAIALHAGTYVEANYAREPQGLRHVYEAYAGFRPLAKVWLDVGIFQSHIGFESALSKDNWTLTRSLMAENSPYYEAGARFSYEPTATLTFTALVLNGWQNLRENNRAKALGTQVQWKPNSKLTLNSSTFVGNEQPTDSVPRRRYFHNAYVSYVATERLSVALVFDVGAQQRNPRSSGADLWHTGAGFVRHQLSEKWSATARGEFYRASRGVVIRSVAPAAGERSVHLGGGSLNLDYAPSEHVLCRVEGRMLHSNGKIFERRNSNFVNNYNNITSSVAISF